MPMEMHADSENAQHSAGLDAVQSHACPNNDEARTAGETASYDIVLTKGVAGLGIYFTASPDGAAIVDRSMPFYRLPDGGVAPGEASGVIAPGDRLAVINGNDVRNWTFQLVVEELRRVPLGDVVLHFERESGRELPDLQPPLIETGESMVTDDSAISNSSRRPLWAVFDRRGQTSSNAPFHEDTMKHSAAMEELLLDMETKMRLLEESVEREKKCRFLSEKKNILYRNALRSLSDENAQLRYKLAMETRAHGDTQRFQQSLQLSI